LPHLPDTTGTVRICMARLIKQREKDIATMWAAGLLGITEAQTKLKEPTRDGAYRTIARTFKAMWHDYTLR